MNRRGALNARFRLVAALLLLTASIALVQGAFLWFRPAAGRPVSPRLLSEIRSDIASPSIGSRSMDRPLIAVFTDYQCAICRADHQAVMQVAKSNPGMRFVFKEWAILGDRSLIAARLALAARYQGRYIELRDALMDRGVAKDMIGFEAMARSAGVDWNVLLRDLDVHAGEIDAELARVSRQSAGLGLRGTPAYLVGNKLIEGRLTHRQLARLIQAC